LLFLKIAGNLKFKLNYIKLSKMPENRKNIEGET